MTSVGPTAPSAKHLIFTMDRLCVQVSTVRKPLMLEMPDSDDMDNILSGLL